MYRDVAFDTAAASLVCIHICVCFVLMYFFYASQAANFYLFCHSSTYEGLAHTLYTEYARHAGVP